MAFNQDVVGQTFGPTKFEYDWQRTALYALGCGAGVDELDVLIESRGPKVLPTFSVVPAHKPLLEALTALGGNMLTLVHGSQKCVIEKPIPNGGVLETSCTVTGLYDKGKGALATLTTTSKDEGGAVVCHTEWGIFYRGEGGFGGERGPEAPKFAPEEGKAADAVIEMPTQPTQALLYRLGSNDLNPIHSDPEIAAKAKFPAPILHGLATFGHAGRAVLTLCDNDPDKLVSIEGRFSKPVLPGETIVTELWRVDGKTDGLSEAYFSTKVKERGDTVITLGRALFQA